MLMQPSSSVKYNLRRRFSSVRWADDYMPCSCEQPARVWVRPFAACLPLLSCLFFTESIKAEKGQKKYNFSPPVHWGLGLKKTHPMKSLTFNISL